MVYCGGLENRFGFTADGGSNPSLSATGDDFDPERWANRRGKVNKTMNELTWVIIWSVLGVILFVWLWRAGYLVRFANYVRETREELRKCSWPSWEELKGSTVLIFVAILGIGLYTVAVDQIFFRVFMLFKL